MFRIIFGWIRRLIERSRMRRRIGDIERQNEISKNVIEYHDAPVEAFISGEHSRNIIVSGNNKQIRNRVCCSAAYNAFSNGEGVILLHCDNFELESLLTDAFEGTSGLHLINEFNPCYEPFLNMGKNQIAEMVLSSATDACKVQHNGGIYIKGLTDYLTARGQVPCVRSYNRCPHDTMWRRIQEHVRNGDMTSAVAEEINDELTRGQVERGNVEHYFNVLNSQGSNILADKNVIKAGNGTNIRHALSLNQVVSFDVSPSANDLLMNVFIQEIKNCMANGMRFTLILDSIPADSSEALGKLLRNFSSKCKFVISAKDVYSETANVENLFDSLLGKVDIVFISQHDSAETSEKFSNYLGKYQRLESTSTYTMGDTYSTYGQILPGSNSTNIYGLQRVDRHRVEESEITSLDNNWLFIKEERHSEIIRVHCSSGTARGHYATPRRRPLRRISTKRFSWLIFILLLILIPPAAFIYSLIVCGRTGKIISIIILFLMIAAIVAQIVLMNI